MVVIKKRDNVIPVDFEDFVLGFKANDASIKRVTKLEKQLKEYEKQFSEKEYTEAFWDDLKDIAKIHWNELFGESAFEKVYAYSDESALDTFVYLLAAIRGVIEEYGERNNKDALSKYLE